MADDKTGLPSEEQVRLMLWTVPRSTSTVLSKCLSFVEGSQVFFEPYTCAHHLGPERVRQDTAVEYVKQDVLEKFTDKLFLHTSQLYK